MKKLKEYKDKLYKSDVEFIETYSNWEEEVTIGRNILTTDHFITKKTFMKMILIISEKKTEIEKAVVYQQGNDKPDGWYDVEFMDDSYYFGSLLTEEQVKEEYE